MPPADVADRIGNAGVTPGPLPQLRRDSVEVPHEELAALVSTTNRAPLSMNPNVIDDAEVRPTPRATPGRAGAGRNAGSNYVRPVTGKRYAAIAVA